MSITRIEYLRFYRTNDFALRSNFLSNNGMRLLCIMSSYCPCYPTREQLASSACISAKTVNNIISEMKTQSILKKKRKWITLDDVQLNVVSYEINYDVVMSLYESSRRAISFDEY